MKKIIAFFLSLLMVCSMAACAPKPDHVVVGRYLPEGVTTNESVQKKLGLFLREDGTFYLNCNLSYSYHPSGTYRVKDGVLTLTDNSDIVVAIFNMTDSSTLVYQKKGSAYDATAVGDNENYSFKIYDGLTFVWDSDPDAE